MKRAYILLGLAALGILSAVRVIALGSKTEPAAQPVAAPPVAPYETTVAGTGIVEAASENVPLGTHVPGIVSEVYVKVGDTVTEGQPIFQIDNRELLAQITVGESSVKLATSEVALAKVQRDEQAALYARVSEIADRRMVSDEERDRRKFSLNQAEAQLLSAEAKLSKQSAELTLAKTQLELSTVRAPFAGRLLQLKVRPGQFALAGVVTPPLALIGKVDVLHVRVDVDENDAWRIKAGASATAYVRGNRDIAAPLTFVRIEPYVIPKTSLTGSSAERTDTRVLQILFKFEPKDFPVYVGQLLDVFIEGK